MSLGWGQPNFHPLLLFSQVCCFSWLLSGRTELGASLAVPEGDFWGKGAGSTPQERSRRMRRVSAALKPIPKQTSAQTGDF